ncbi:HR1 rho-binding repeat containing protein, putative [Babesia ovata]|uniref:HR1 rho-binding repeat containing protein, putative n=1 Tax=Babesia ovata TaxID=189622 RepID=A0A2H6KAM6_9APIC|nr:HR1 rho-binding repeat containing protein, putative [Babesia ovata]GBE60043.1 HR1 rho-binding repeat containing protein, putative [Babesia ovata]
MEPVKVLEKIESHSIDCPSNETAATDVSYGKIFSRAPLEEFLKRLFNPPLKDCEEVADPERKKRPREESTPVKGRIKFDKAAISRICPNAEFPFPSSGGDLLFIDESLEMLRSCLDDLPGFKLIKGPEAKGSEPGDPDAYFMQLVDSFLACTDAEEIPEVRLEGETDCNVSDHRHPVNVDANYDRQAIRELLRCLVLWCNWVFQMNAHTKSALSIAQSTLQRSMAPQVIEVALGIKQANRNVAFYSSMCTKITAALRERGSKYDQIIKDTLCKVHHVRFNVGRVHRASSNSSWERLSNKLSKYTTDENEIPMDDMSDEYRRNINLVRNEMRLRMKKKGICDSLSKTCDMLSQELASINSKRQSLLTRMEQAMRQLRDLTTSYRAEAYVESLKLTDSKKLPTLLHNFLSRMQLRAIGTPNRDVVFKVFKEGDRDYGLHMTFAAPRDVLMPSADAASIVFPLLFLATLDERGLVRIREPRFPFPGSAVCDTTPRADCTPRRMECVSIHSESSMSTGSDSPKETIIGEGMVLDTFTAMDKELPQHFIERMEWWYEIARQHVWNCYLADVYRRGRSTPINLLPQELRKHHSSQYTCRSSGWVLGNKCASIRMRLEFTEELEPRCTFSEFEHDEPLYIEGTPPMVDIVRDSFTDVKEDKINEVGESLYIKH